MPAGRPTDYQEEYAQKAFKLCLLGAKDKELADFFEVSEQTLNTWKKKHPEFLESIKEAKSEADANIVNSLYHRAKGMTIKEQKLVNLGEGQGSDFVEIEKELPPDPTAMIFWLKNRQPEKWRDKQEIEHKTTVSVVDLTGEDSEPD